MHTCMSHLQSLVLKLLHSLACASWHTQFQSSLVPSKNIFHFLHTRTGSHYMMQMYTTVIPPSF